MYTIGIDLGGTKILAALINQKQEKIAELKVETKAFQGVKAVLERIDVLINDLITSQKIKKTELAGIGFGVPGPVDKNTGIVLVAPNLGWKNVDICSFLKDKYPVYIHVENDVNAGIYGEYILGFKQKYQNMVGMFVGTGIGGGIIINGNLYSGCNGLAGEIGHMIIKYKGAKCNCGQLGCLEAYSSKTGLINHIKKSKDKQADVLKKYLMEKNDVLKSSFIKKQIEEKNQFLIKQIKKMAGKMAIGIINIANILNPDAIVLGGGFVTSLGDIFLNPIREKITTSAFSTNVKGLKIELSVLGDSAVMMGAALLANKNK